MSNVEWTEYRAEYVGEFPKQLLLFSCVGLVLYSSVPHVRSFADSTPMVLSGGVVLAAVVVTLWRTKR